MSLCQAHVSLRHNERLIRGEDEQQEEPDPDKQGRKERRESDVRWQAGKIVESIVAETIKMNETMTASEENLF